MKEKITCSYEAIDGTTFANREECIEYELTKMKEGLTLILLDDKGEKINNIDEEGYSRAYYIIVNSQADIDYVKYIAEVYGYYHPWSTKDIFAEQIGIYKFYDEEDDWENYDEEVDQINKQYSELCKWRKAPL